MARTVYDPADPGLHSDWARRQESIDQMVEAGQITIDGSLESSASGAARTQNVIAQPPQLNLLMGLDDRSTVALMQEPAGYTYQRTFSLHLAVPELGSVEARKSKIDAIERELRHGHPGENSLVQQEGVSILSGIHITIEQDALIADARGRIGELVSG